MNFRFRIFSIITLSLFLAYLLLSETDIFGLSGPYSAGMKNDKKATPKFYSMLNYEQRESERRLGEIDELLRQNTDAAPKYKISTCVVQKSMSTVMTSIFCYLRDENKFVANHREILRDWKIIRFCKFRNEFKNLGGLFKKFDIQPNGNSNWTHIMIVRHPVERFVSGFVDKCYRKPVVSEFCNGCGRNLTCFMETELERMTSQVQNGSFLRTYEDRHFFPQNWRCNLHQYFSNFTFLHYTSDPKHPITDSLFKIFREQNVPSKSIAYINNSLSSGRTAHSTVDTRARRFIEDRLLSSPYLMEILVRMFYQDFLLFNYTLPF